MRQPLGIGAGITPFNFPAMIPMWMFGIAIACGNAFILKPSERDPAVPVRLAELMKEAGLPDGILKVVHGDKEMVDAILDHPDIEAVSFVGSSDIAQYIYSRGTANGKRVQAFGGAKNHGIVMPDADLDQVVNDLAGAAFGSAGERCMALPVVVPVGEDTADAPAREADPRDRRPPRRRLDRSRGALRPGGQRGAQGAGRALHPDGHRRGRASWSSTAAASRSRATRRASSSARPCSTMSSRACRATRTRSSAPSCRSSAPTDFEEAVRLPSEHHYGNGVAIFTRNGHAAREFAARVNVGMVGINVPIPVPVAYHSFGGWKRSGFGDINQHGMEGVRFWTKNKIMTQRWPDGGAWRERVIRNRPSAWLRKPDEGQDRCGSSERQTHRSCLALRGARICVSSAARSTSTAPESRVDHVAGRCGRQALPPRRKQQTPSTSCRTASDNADVGRPQRSSNSF